MGSSSAEHVSEKEKRRKKGIFKACSEPCQTSKIKHFAKIINGLFLLTIFTKRTILDVWQGSE